MEKMLFSFFVASLIFTGCKKEKINKTPDILAGKIKSVTVTSEIFIPDSGYEVYTFIYDPISGDLIKGIHTYTGVPFFSVDSVIIDKMNATTIRLNYYFLENTLPDKTYYAYLDADGYVAAIGSVFPFDDQPDHTYIKCIYGENHELDTLYEPKGGSVYENVYHKMYDLTFDGNNYTQTTNASYGDDSWLPPFDVRNVYYTYTALPNTGYVPIQFIYGNSGNPGMIDLVFEPLYLLNQNGYYAFRPNRHLIGEFNNGYQFTFEYETDANNRVTSLDWGNDMVFKLDYY